MEAPGIDRFCAVSAQYRNGDDQALGNKNGALPIRKAAVSLNRVEAPGIENDLWNYAT